MREEKKRRPKWIEKHSIAKTAVIYSRSAKFILVLLSSTLLVIMFSETMLLPAIPEIMQDFNIPYSTAAWIFSAYLIVAAVMTPIAGKLSDIYGSKQVLLILLILYVVGVVAGGFSENISFLLVSRIIQGVGLAAVPVAFSIIRDSFPPEKLAMPVGVFSTCSFWWICCRITNRCQYNTEFWMACYIPLYNSSSSDYNFHDCQICSS